MTTFKNFIKLNEQQEPGHVVLELSFGIRENRFITRLVQDMHGDSREDKLDNLALSFAEQLKKVVNEQNIEVSMEWNDWGLGAKIYIAIEVINGGARGLENLVETHLPTMLDNATLDDIVPLQMRLCLTHGLPDFYVSYPQVLIQSTESLHNIHKLVDCTTLRLDAKAVKSDVLGLLQIKSMNFLYQEPSEVKLEPWFQIVKKHQMSDQDETACRNELVKAGLKEYAGL